jgi:hypothetical protein
MTLNYSRDGGETFKKETNQILYGTYFFLHQTVEEHYYEANNFVTLVSDLGGLIEFMYILLSFIPLLYNQKVSRQKFIEKLYFVDKPLVDRLSKSKVE